MTPRTMLAVWLAMSREMPMKMSPVTRNTHQHRVPKWYSDLMTIGWKKPMMKKVDIAVISPK